MRTNIQKTYADEFVGPICTREVALDAITPETVRAELKANYYIIIPSRLSIYRTPELTAKRDILMRMVYRGEISIDLHGANSPGGEVGLVFFNLKPRVD